MKTTFSLVLALVTISAAPAFAGGKSSHSSGCKSGSKTSNSNCQHSNSQKMNQKIKPQSIKVHDLTSNNSQKLPVGSNRVDGRVPLTTSTSIPTKPGFVWTGNHWERAKSTTSSLVHNPGQGSASVNQLPVDPVSGFNNLGNTPPAVVLNPAGVQTGRPNHFADRAPGGVTVTIVPGSQRPNDVTGVGGSPIDKVIDVFNGSEFEPGRLPYEQVRDHRTP